MPDSVKPLSLAARALIGVLLVALVVSFAGVAMLVASAIAKALVSL